MNVGAITTTPSDMINECLGKPFGVGDSLRKDIRVIEQICLSPCLLAVIRIATILPLLKAGKSPGEVASFHPISLTSYVVKLLERIIADRLYYTAETNNMFSRFQAGFCKGRSCEDQIT